MVIKYVGPQLQEFIGVSVDDFRKAGNDFKYVLEPLKDIHLKGAPQYNLEPPGSSSIVYIFAVIAIMILLIAIINYVNLATAKSASRAKEVGVKKVAGFYPAFVLASYNPVEVLKGTLNPGSMSKTSGGSWSFSSLLFP